MPARSATDDRADPVNDLVDGVAMQASEVRFTEVAGSPHPTRKVPTRVTGSCAGWTADAEGHG
ncbi:hypothetical protein ACTWPB_09140 [Nocardia sp. IBHARD005]|uniref:hypothetical protein n=1 Tax=Nocardia sp. IBHARD005 TaxID=3457765 RepID=UPI00405858D2